MSDAIVARYEWGGKQEYKQSGVAAADWWADRLLELQRGLVGVLESRVGVRVCFVMVLREPEVDITDCRSAKMVSKMGGIAKES